MSVQPFFAAPGVSVTNQLAKVYGRSYVIGQLTAVEYDSDRPWWRFLFGIGLGMLLLCAAFAYMVVNNIAYAAMPLWMIGAVLSFLIGISLFLGGSFRMVQCAFSSTAGNYLEFTMSDGRTQKLYGVRPAEGRAIKNAIEQAIVAHYSRA